MTSEEIQQALALFREACERPAHERAAFLESACGGNVALRRQVENMLRWDHDSDDDEAPESIRAVLSELAEQAGNGADQHAAALPTSIGGYRVTRLIAHGGMGDVYEARQEHPERRVAIKVARISGTTGERARRFELEAQLLARLQHPRIAQIIEAGTTSPETGSQPFFVMEFVDGQSLTDYAADHLASARAKLELMVTVCDAVGFAHQSGVTHRDLKPDNVLIEASGAPKVLDFGVAKVESAGGFGAATLRTEAGRIVGTLGYMAPEQLGGKSDGLGPEADVYSLGVMIYQLLSGRLPHELDAVTLTRALAVVTTTDAPLLGVIRPEYRGDIEAVVAMALEKDSRYRYADAMALKADLERYLRGEPTLAKPAGPLRRVVKWTRRNPALATAVFGLFLSLATAATVLLLMNQEVATALDDYDRLKDARKLEEAAVEATLGWPTRTHAQQLGAWIDTYRPLLDNLDGHRDAVVRLRAEADNSDDPELQWKLQRLVDLVANLESFGGKHGLLTQVEQRHHLARAMKERTCDSRSEDWQACIDRIRNNPKYAGLELTPQIGLIPLGPDPASGLEEFLHLETHSGPVPPAGRGERIPLRMGGKTGLVFVLIPSGSFWMGAEPNPRPGLSPEQTPNSDPDVIVGWELSYWVPHISAFFMSKYEMTRGQWHDFTAFTDLADPIQDRQPEPAPVALTVTGLDCLWLLRRFIPPTWEPVPVRGVASDLSTRLIPSTELRPEESEETVPRAIQDFGGLSVTLPGWLTPSPPRRRNPPRTRPVTQVSFLQCEEVLRRLGMVIPDLEQWEYAARAGTKTAYWTGMDHRSLKYAENILDQTWFLYAASWYERKERVQHADYFDISKLLRVLLGKRGNSPIGSYEANGFGLFDVAGSVTEYASFPMIKSPEGTSPRRPQNRCIIRGGNDRYGADHARSAARVDIAMDFRAPVIGIRPAMAIQD